MKKQIVIGTRGSKLALVQTTLVKELLERLLPDYTIVIKVIVTHGDTTLKPIPLDTVGKGWFTKELDDVVRDGTVDIAVHSLKDIPDGFPDDLTIAAIPDREDAREALVSRNGLSLAKLPPRAVIGTDSIRRKVQILTMRPDVVVKSLRGNVPTRIQKLDRGDYDAICLAVAGLKRLDMEHRITEYFDEKVFVPSPGQGAIAIVSRKKNRRLNKLLQKLQNEQVIITTTAERIFSTAMGGGCSLPVGAFAKIRANKITIYGMIGSLDGKYILKETITGDKENYRLLAKKLARNMLKQSLSWYQPVTVVITRPIEKRDPFISKLKQLGCRVVVLPSIRFVAMEVTLPNTTFYDWIIFTSKNAVAFFSQKVTKANKIAAVGEQTAKTLKKYGVTIDFVPSQFTTESLIKELPDVKGKKVLLPRSDIANPDLPKQLEANGATVVELLIYKTLTATFDTQLLEELLTKKQKILLTFTSPSTVKGFLENVKNSSFKKQILLLPAFSIGPATTKAAKKYGFTNMHTADTFTTEGIAQKIQEFLLQ